LSQFPSHKSAPEVVAGLLKAGPSPKIVRLAGQYLKSSGNLIQLRPIIRAILESPPHPGLYKKIAHLLENNPGDSDWYWALLTTSKPRNERTDRLVVRWLQLNVGNPELSISPYISRARSPEIIEAGFDWMRAGDVHPKTCQR
jgi:hypothetical protein